MECACGCGEPVTSKKKGSRFVHGHNGRLQVADISTCRECGREAATKEAKYLQTFDSVAKTYRCSAWTPAGCWTKLTFSCVGYEDHGVIRFARTCRRSVVMSRSKAHAWLRLQERKAALPYRRWGVGANRPSKWQRSFLDLDSLQYRCGRCATGSLMINTTEQRIRGWSSERIYSGQMRRELMSGYVVPPPGKPYPVRGSPAHRQGISRGGIVKAWSADKLPGTHVFLCTFCGRIGLAASNTRGVSRHRACLYQWMKTSEGRKAARNIFASEMLPRPRRKRGRPSDNPDVLRRHFSWTIQKLIAGVDYRKIARRYGVSDRAVRDGVEGIITRLPVSENIQQRYRSTIDTLRAALELTPQLPPK